MLNNILIKRVLVYWLHTTCVIAYLHIIHGLIKNLSFIFFLNGWLTWLCGQFWVSPFQVLAKSAPPPSWKASPPHQSWCNYGIWRLIKDCLWMWFPESTCFCSVKVKSLEYVNVKDKFVIFSDINWWNKSAFEWCIVKNMLTYMKALSTLWHHIWWM